MSRRITIIQGHPDPGGGHFSHALAVTYTKGAEAAGHQVRRIDVAEIVFPVLRSKAEWNGGPVPDAIRAAQQDIRWADHLVIIYPLWLGSLPALLKAFLEQVLRPGFAVAATDSPNPWTKLLKGRSARIVVTMGMPALVYRWYFRAHSLKSLERNILRFCGIAPVKASVIGMVEAPGGARRERWLAKMNALGRAGR